jgi:hypothetical protein
MPQSKPCSAHVFGMQASASSAASPTEVPEDALLAVLVVEVDVVFGEPPEPEPDVALTTTVLPHAAIITKAAARTLSTATGFTAVARFYASPGRASRAGASASPIRDGTFGTPSSRCT